MTQSTTTKTRFRKEVVTCPTYTQRAFSESVPVGPLIKVGVDTIVDKFAAYESLTSTGHKGPPFLEGGPFKVTRYSMKRTVAGRNVQYTETSLDGKSGTTYMLDGPSYVNDSDVSHPITANEADFKFRHDHMALPTVDLNSYGAKGVAKYSPLSPGANLGQTILETYIDGLPRIPLNALANFRKFLSDGRGSTVDKIQRELKAGGGLPAAGSSEYLNYVFGWVPLLKDLQALYNTWKTLNERMAQIIRDNNKPIRRGGTLYKNSSVVHTPLAAFGYKERMPFSTESTDNSNPAVIAQAGTLKTVTTSENIWFSGRFHYFIPDVTDDQWTINAKLALFGAYPSPSLLYEVMPWSWLIDWFSNVGDVISNSSSNGIADLVIDYAYVMRHYKRLTQYTTRTVPQTLSYLVKGKGQTLRSAVPKVFITTVLEESKERAVASPFGFGKQLTSISGRQAAILAALGLSRINFT